MRTGCRDVSCSNGGGADGSGGEHKDIIAFGEDVWCVVL